MRETQRNKIRRKFVKFQSIKAFTNRAKIGKGFWCASDPHGKDEVGGWFGIE